MAIMNTDPEERAENGTLPEAMAHWYSIRKSYPEDFLIAYRMGDFYEFFYDDAVRISQLVGITLTGRGQGPNRHPLAGIPHKSAANYFKNLVRLGQTVVMVDQLEDPKTVKGRIVKRGVTKILSPGTIVDDNLLDSKSSNYICSIYRDKKNYGLALVELSSGDFYVTEFYGKDAQRMLWAYLTRYSPVECVLPQDINADSPFLSELHDTIKIIIKEHSQYQFLYQNARDTLLKQFHMENLGAFGIDSNSLSICAAGGLLSFILETQKESLANITKVQLLHDESYMFLDVATQRNLEILKNAADGSEFGTLYSVMDLCRTPMGTRLLKSWLVQPLMQIPQIEYRLDMVDFFIQNPDIRAQLHEYLSHIGDLTRLITRINYSSTANARDLLSIKNGLQIIKEVKTLCASIQNPNFKTLIADLQDFESLISLIERGIHEQPPITITDGNIIKDGYNTQVDELRNIINHGKDWVISFEEKEKKRLGIGSGLKISFNRILGYFIQITENAVKDVTLPPEYTQRQSLKGGIRFDTPELKSMETKILSADDSIKDLEYDLFQAIRAEVQKATAAMQKNAEILAMLDVYANLAEIAQTYNFTRPRLASHQKVMIRQGRHPVVERLLKKEPFVPNDSLLNKDADLILIITGPNWSGKSTYLRQVALIVLMAQIGSFVPAADVEVGIVDRIFTRIGASDDLARGQSTFLLEMNETAQILNYASERSLVLIDELGRGTGTVDGQAIAQAVIEYLHDAGIKTLFSTHFHQLINLKLPRIHNYHFKIIENEETKKLIFLRQLVDGGTDKSYGIHVAMMAGLLDRVIDRAFDLVDHGLIVQPSLPIDNAQKHLAPSKPVSSPDTSPSIVSAPTGDNVKISSNLDPKKAQKKTVQAALFPIIKYDDSEIVIILRSLDLDNLTPLQAFEALKKLKSKLHAGTKS